MSKRTVRLYDMVNIQLNVDKKKASFIKDNIFGQNRGHSLVARIAATHAGIITRNNGFYLPDKMAQGAESFTKPYPKPVLLHHDSYQDPVGRIVAAEYVNTSGSLIKKDSRIADVLDPKQSFINKVGLIDGLLKDEILDDPDYQGLGFVSTIVNITDPEAIQKISDNRYLTVSIGASTDKAVCSICKADWVDDGPCEHRPGEMYDEKKAFIIAGNLMYEELSFVNSPADPFARVIEVQNSTGETEQFKLEYEDDEIITDEKAELYIITDDNVATTLTDNDLKEGVRSLFADMEKQKETSANEHSESTEEEEEDTTYREPSSSPAGTKKKKKKKKKKSDDSTEEATVSEKDKDTTKVDGAEHDDKEVVDQEEQEISATDDQKAPEDKVTDSEQEETKEETKPEDKVEDKEEEKVEDKKEDEAEEKEEDKAEEKVEDKKEEPEDKVEDKEEIKEEVSPPEPSETKKTDDEVDSDIKVLESVTLDDVKDTERLTAKIKEAYDFMTDEQVAEAIKEIQTEALRDNFLAEIMMVIQRVTGTILDRDFDADAFYAEMEKELDEIGSDAKLSTAQRKKLPNSAFCGPNRSFPVPDCAHVTASRKLIGDAKLASTTKTKILASISRKAKALGCADKKEEVKPEVKEEVKEQEVKKQELTCDTFKALTEEEFKTVTELVKAEAEEREIELVEAPQDSEDSEELETAKAAVAELEAQLKALRSELKDVYQDCGDLEDAKAELLESLHKERAQRLCEMKVLTGEINDQGELEKHLEEEIAKGSKILLENLTNISDKVNLYEVAEKLNDGMANKPEGEVEDPTLGNTEDDTSEEDISSKIRSIYNDKVVEEGQRAANRYLNSLRKARLLPSNFKL
jgi:hypothetical protein